jgi:hypothetical protein
MNFLLKMIDFWYGGKGIKIKAGLRTELRREPWEIELADITD